MKSEFSTTPFNYLEFVPFEVWNALSKKCLSLLLIPLECFYKMIDTKGYRFCNVATPLVFLLKTVKFCFCRMYFSLFPVNTATGDSLGPVVKSAASKQNYAEAF